MWWCDREKSYKLRDPSKPIIWSRTPDWKPEERNKNQSGYHLQHDEVKVGRIYKFFENPDRKVRAERVYINPSQVHVIKLDGSGGRIIFTDELEETQLNSTRARRNWCKRRGAKRRARGEYLHYKYGR